MLWKKKKKDEEKKFPTLTSTKKFAYLAHYYGDDGVLDLTTASISRRFVKHLKNMKTDCNIALQPLVTLEKREMILEIPKC